MDTVAHPAAEEDTVQVEAAHTEAVKAAVVTVEAAVDMNLNLKYVYID